MEIKIKLDELKKILMESYKKGWHGSLDLNEENADSILEKYAVEDDAESPNQLFFADTSQWSNISVTVDGVVQTGVDPADRSTWTILSGD